MNKQQLNKTGACCRPPVIISQAIHKQRCRWTVAISVLPAAGVLYNFRDFWVFWLQAIVSNWKQFITRLHLHPEREIRDGLWSIIIKMSTSEWRLKSWLFSKNWIWSLTSQSNENGINAFSLIEKLNQTITRWFHWSTPSCHGGRPSAGG